MRCRIRLNSSLSGCFWDALLVVTRGLQKAHRHEPPVSAANVISQDEENFSLVFVRTGRSKMCSRAWNLSILYNG